MINKELIEDVVKIAQYKLWDNEAGNKKAQEIIDEIHSGKYGSKIGIWPQVYEELEKI